MQPQNKPEWDKDTRNVALARTGTTTILVKVEGGWDEWEVDGVIVLEPRRKDATTE